MALVHFSVIRPRVLRTQCDQDGSFASGGINAIKQRAMLYVGVKATGGARKVHRVARDNLAGKGDRAGCPEAVGEEAGRLAEE